MEINYLHSIKEILPEDCIDTNGSRPIKVLCNDMNDYVCKYFTSFGFASSLFNEYLAASFLKIWEVPVPDFAIVKVKTEHTKRINFPIHYFDKSCFGSKFQGGFKEVDKFFITMPQVLKINETTLNSFLKIALFDLWLCNEDRHHENFNLLYDIKSNLFVPIDHVCCFNSNSLDKEAYPISDNESLLSSPFLSRFFSRPLQQNRKQIRLKITKEFKLDVNRCHEKLDDILSQTPLDWKPDIDFLRQRLLFFFSEPWISQCLNNFNRLFEIYSTQKK